ncbi:MAG: c-type cytochrome [Planctomycetota bacterium]|jgi:mono/diheme cytochrome c family protein
MKNSLVLVLGIVVAVCFTLGQTCIPPTPSPTPAPTPTPGGGGDATNGAALFAQNGCDNTLCHGSDGSGGILEGSNIKGASVAIITTNVEAGTSHTGGEFTSLTAQDIADIAAFLAQ